MLVVVHGYRLVMTSIFLRSWLVLTARVWPRELAINGTHWMDCHAESRARPPVSDESVRFPSGDIGPPRAGPGRLVAHQDDRGYRQPNRGEPFFTYSKR